MQWVRAACVRSAPAMRVCARSYLGRASIVKTVVDIFATTFKCLSVCRGILLSEFAIDKRLSTRGSCILLVDSLVDDIDKAST